MPESRNETAGTREESRKAAFEKFDKAMNEAQEALTDEEREMLNRALSRRNSNKSILSNNKTLQFLLVALPVAIIIVAIAGLAQTIAYRNTQRVAKDKEAISHMAEAWYGQWEYVNGEMTTIGTGDLSGFFAVGSTAQTKYRHTEGGDPSLFVLDAPTKLVSYDIEDLREREYKLTINYYEADGEVDQATWEALQASGPQTASYRVIMDTTSRITDVQELDS